MGSGQMFDKIAGRYDMINTAITAGLHNTWRRRMVESLELKPGHTVLDAGTGTADVAIALAKHLRKSGGELSTDSVVGVDPSQGMLAIGRKKVGKAGFSDKAVRLVHGDAQDLAASLPPGVLFDAATMAFAIRNVPDRGAALRSIAAHLRDGARLVILELSQPSFRPARWVIKHVVPRLGAALSGGARREYRYLEQSLAKFDPEQFKGLLHDTGFDLVSLQFMMFGSVGLYVAQRRDRPPAAPQDAGEEQAGGAV